MTKKAGLINKLAALSAKEKRELILFFTENPVYENLIDWNNRDLKWEDFASVLALKKMSRKNRKNTVKMFTNQNCRIIAQTKDFIIVIPLDWHCAVFLNSFNCGGEGAKWCIGSKDSETNWDEYMAQGNIFYFIYFFKRHPIFGKKIIIEMSGNCKPQFYTQKDSRHDFDLLANYLYDRMFRKKKNDSTLALSDRATGIQ